MDTIDFLRDVMRRRRKLPSQLAADIGVSHATMHRWLAGNDVPNPRSCQLLAEYSGIPTQEVLTAAGHLIGNEHTPVAEWPEFREYAHQKYADELDEDVIAMIEDLIERRREQRVTQKRKHAKAK